MEFSAATRLLVIGAIRGADGRQQILRLGLRGRWLAVWDSAGYDRPGVFVIDTGDRHKLISFPSCTPPPMLIAEGGHR